MNCRVLICLGLFVLMNWSCRPQPKDPKAVDLDEVKVAISSIENERPGPRSLTEFLNPISLDEGKVIEAIYPEYFDEVFDPELSDLVGVDYVRDELSPKDWHTIEEVSGYALPDDQQLVLIHWSPINGPGSHVTEVFVIKQNGSGISVASTGTPGSRIEYGGGTIISELPKPVAAYSISEGKLAFAISQAMHFGASDSYNEEVFIMEINGDSIDQVFDYKAYSGHSSFRLRDELGATEEELILIGSMIPNHVFRTGIEQVESKLHFAPNLTNGHYDFILKEETYQLSDDLKEIHYDFRETLFQFDGNSYVEGGKVNS